jgi:AcrR family transcriptional regulator
MSTSTRQRLIQSALQLFITQGVSTTTTRQIAELAQVNEVTLFRNFGNKYGLLLAVLEESTAFNNLGKSLVERVIPADSISETLKKYASSCLHSLEQVPEFIRSLVGESEQYPIENRRALGKGLNEANRYVADYLATIIEQGQLNTHISPEKLASFLNGMILGYAIIEFTSEFHELWDDRDDFLDNLVELFLNGAISPTVISAEFTEYSSRLAKIDTNFDEDNASSTVNKVIDLPANLVHQILQKARKSGLEDFALAYVLFASGLSIDEVANLQKMQQICDENQHILQIVTPETIRQVPVNQWIMGKRYGSYTNNPLTKWLKSRKDSQAAMFTKTDIQECWQIWTQGLLTPEGQPPTIIQAQQTWRVEMLMRGMSLDNLSILTGCDRASLEPFAQRAKEKAAIDEALNLDKG